MREWTGEARDSSYRMLRGGDISFDVSPSARSFTASASSTVNVAGTRMQLYVTESVE